MGRYEGRVDIRCPSDTVNFAFVSWSRTWHTDRVGRAASGAEVLMCERLHIANNFHNAVVAENVT